MEAPIARLAGCRQNGTLLPDKQRASRSAGGDNTFGQVGLFASRFEVIIREVTCLRSFRRSISCFGRQNHATTPDSPGMPSAGLCSRIRAHNLSKTTGSPPFPRRHSLTGEIWSAKMFMHAYLILCAPVASEYTAGGRAIVCEIHLLLRQ